MGHINRLNARRVATIKTPGRWSDGGGLYLSITPSGAKRWVFMYRRGKKQTEIGVHADRARGLASLVDAREAAARYRTMLRDGLDPKTAKRPPVTMSFAACVDGAMETRKWRNRKSPANWRMTLTVYCQSIHDLPVQEVSTEHVLAILKPLWMTRQATAVKLRGRIEFVLGWATVMKHRSDATANPARWKNHLEMLLSKPDASHNHHPAMDYRNLPVFVAELRKQDCIAALALEFMILSACRVQEILGATWSEVVLDHLDGPVLEIPGARMKMGRDHRLPLSPRCVEIIKELGEVPVNDFIFPGAWLNRPISTQSLKNLMTQMGFAETRHGFRATFKTWAADAGRHRDDIVEASLAHTQGRLHAAYQRSDLLDRRRVLMNDWCNYVTRPVDAKVLPMRRRK